MTVRMVHSMFIPIWIIVYIIIFVVGAFYGKYVWASSFNSFNKFLMAYCTLAALFLILVWVVLLLGYSPTVLTFC